MLAPELDKLISEPQRISFKELRALRKKLKLAPGVQLAFCPGEGARDNSCGGKGGSSPSGPEEIPLKSYEVGEGWRQTGKLLPARVNPTPKEVIAQAQRYYVRALFDPASRDIYTWKAESATHQEVEKSLNLKDAGGATFSSGVHTAQDVEKQFKYWYSLKRPVETSLPLPDSVQLAFCPTGPGGGTDNSCGGKSSGPPGGIPGSDLAHAIPCGADIEKAAKLLAEGKFVELDQPEQVSSLLDVLRDQIDAAISKGEKAPVINLCQVSVPGTNLFCQDNLDIPRIEMPQMRGFPIPGGRADELPVKGSGKVDIGKMFVKHLRYEEGIDVEKTEIRASHLRASQRELDADRTTQLIAESRDRSRDLRERPIFVTKDNYIVDGHHHWAAIVAEGHSRGRDPKIPVYRLDVKIGKALPLAVKYGEYMGISRQASNVELGLPEDIIFLGFCPTGPGGGIDNSCGKSQGERADRLRIEKNDANKRLRAAWLEHLKDKDDPDKHQAYLKENREYRKLLAQAKKAEAVANPKPAEPAKPPLMQRELRRVADEVKDRKADALRRLDVAWKAHQADKENTDKHQAYLKENREYRGLLRQAKLAEVAAKAAAEPKPEPVAKPLLGDRPEKFENATPVSGSTERLGGGISNTYKVKMETPNGEKFQACYKPEAPPPGGYAEEYKNYCARWAIDKASPPQREAATYSVDKALGLGIIPPTIMVNNAPYGQGSAQKWISDGKNGDSLSIVGRAKWLEKPEHAEQALKMTLMDFVMGNPDRHNGNMKIDQNGKGNLHAIDNGFTLHPHVVDKDGLGMGPVGNQFTGHFRGNGDRTMTDGVRAAFAQVKDPAWRANLHEELKAFPKVSASQREGIVKRMEYVNKAIENGTWAEGRKIIK